jgi:hypothetical protein
MGKKSKAPPPPDYTKLAEQTAASNKAAMDQQTVSNRPNQNNPYGSSQWEQGPGGQWTQNVTLNPAEQAQLDRQRGLQAGMTTAASGLLGNATDSLSKPLTAEGLPGMTGYDPSKLAQVDPNSMKGGIPGMGSLQADPFTMDAAGNSKEIQDAWMSRLAPQREQQRNMEIQRLKNQGLTEGSDAFNSGMERLDRGDVDAQNQALLHGVQEYGNVFNRGLQSNQNNFGQNAAVANFGNQSNAQGFGQNAQTQAMLAALRGQQFGEQGQMAGLNDRQRLQGLQERQMLRQQPLNDLNQLMGGSVQNPVFGNFANAGNSGGTNYSGAGQDQYKAAMDDYNAGQARNSNMWGGLMGLGGSFLGGPAGGMLGSALGSYFKPGG